MAKKEKKKRFKKRKNCSPPLKLLLLHSSSSSSVVEVVRQDQDEPGDVNLLLSPLTLAFAGGNTSPMSLCQEALFADTPASEKGERTQHLYDGRRRLTDTLNVDVCMHVLMSASDTSSGRQLQLTAKPYFIQSRGSREKNHTSWTSFTERASLRNGTCYFSSERCHKTVCIRLMKNPNDEDAIMMMMIWQANGALLNLRWLLSHCNK